MDLQLDGKVAMVTGARKGIGRHVAEHLAAEGADVAIATRTAGPLEITAKEIRAATAGPVLPLAGDMGVTEDVARRVTEDVARRVTEDVARRVTAVQDRLGPLGILVTCAGSSPGGLLEDLAEEQWMSSLNLKFMGHVRSVRAAVGQMRERGTGSIVLVARNDGRYGVRINTVNPGPVNTDQWDTLEKAFARDKGVSQDRAHQLAEDPIPFGWICEPAEVAALVTFLASPKASFVNGAHIPVDGAQCKAIMDR